MTPAPEWAADLRDSIDGERPALDAALAVDRTPERWERAHVAVRVGILDYAAPCVTVDEWGVRDAIAAVRAAVVAGEGLDAARRAADTAYYAALAAVAAEGAWAAYAATYAAREAASADVAAYGAWAADAAAYAAAAAYDAAADAAYCAAARAAAWDRIADIFLTQMEATP